LSQQFKTHLVDPKIIFYYLIYNNYLFLDDTVDP
jgi:hypothetical protein